jgi:hypothetical protein
LASYGDVVHPGRRVDCSRGDFPASGVGNGMLAGENRAMILRLVILSTFFWAALALAQTQSAINPAGISYNVTVGKAEVPCHLTGRSAVIVTLGQSLFSNTVRVDAAYDPGPSALNFNVLDRKCYRASDPLLGTDGDGANQATRIAGLLLESKAYDSVVIVPLSLENTWISQWAPGGFLHERIMKGLDLAVAAGLTPDFILWQQGAAESNSPPQPPNGLTWQSSFKAIAASIRDAGISAPIYVAQSTICRKTPNSIIRAAQAAVVNGKDILAGPDTDTISVTWDRYDGCHLSGTGAAQAAKLWVEAMSRPSGR